MKETDLYHPLEAWLHANGYTVHAEVKGADIVAEKDNDIIAVEIKLHLNLTLVLQAVERQASVDNVYIALPLPRSMRNRSMRREYSLLRRLGLGLVYVNPNAVTHIVQIAFHPGPYTPPRKKKKREAILREISDRIGNYNTGGSIRTKLMTAYRQRTIEVACCLRELGEAGPAELKKMGCPDDTGQILNHNHYGWFEKTARGRYRLDKAGHTALRQYGDLVSHFSSKFAGDNQP
ncbi:MAG: hypothetical protein JW874_05560 [Spirochaetales bacterium]|nr:hypothetical protein [Spirochaetales bacterium]